MLLGSLAQLAATIARMLLAAAPAPGPVGSAPPPRSAVVVFGGDIMSHRDLNATFAANGGEALYEPIAPVIRAADLAFANLETPIAPSQPLTASAMHFNAHAEFAQAMAHAGFDGALIANNHAWDAGTRGIAETVTTVRAAGLVPIGGALAGDDPLAPQRFPLAGSTLCVIAATRVTNWILPPIQPTEAHIALARGPAEQDALVNSVTTHRASCGALVVSLHAGTEYLERPDRNDRAFFHRLADVGADAVVVHHTHVVQAVELYATGGRQVPIFYSLGNFVSNQGNVVDANMSESREARPTISYDPRLRSGILAVFRFEYAGPTALRIAEFGYVPLWIVNTRPHVRSAARQRICAALMPREGGGERLLTERWRAILARAGEEYLLPEASLPGAAEAHALGDAMVIASRRGRAVPPRGTTVPGGTEREARSGRSRH